MPRMPYWDRHRGRIACAATPAAVRSMFASSNAHEETRGELRGFALPSRRSRLRGLARARHTLRLRELSFVRGGHEGVVDAKLCQLASLQVVIESAAVVDVHRGSVEWVFELFAPRHPLREAGWVEEVRHGGRVGVRACS